MPTRHRGRVRSVRHAKQELSLSPDEWESAEAVAATLAEPGRWGANEPAVVLGEASLPGSASAAADEPGGTNDRT